MQVTKTVLLLLIVTCCSLTGCGDGGNQVIQPTQVYQPTDQERENAERIAEQMDKQR